MSGLTAYLALAILPLVYSFIPNPVALYWEFKNPSIAMPRAIAEKAERAGRYVLLPMEALVIMLVSLLMLKHSVPPARVGIRLEEWEKHIGIGIIAGFSWVGFQGILPYVFPVLQVGLSTHFRQKGTVPFWVFVDIFGSSAEEFWRAFCLFALMNSGHALSTSVALTAIAFSAAHTRLRAGAFMTAIFGIGAALLFLWQQSFLTTASAHLIANLGGLYWIRRAKHLTRAATPPRDVD